MEAEAMRRLGGIALVCALILAGCGGAPAQKPEPAAPAVTPATPTTPAVPAAPDGFPSARYESKDASGGQVYRIATAESQMDIYVYRAGRLARFGHNHIVTTRAVSGFILAAKEPSSSRLDLYFPVESLSVDEPELRVAAGDQFSSQPSASDIAGTRKNMLSEKMLNGAAYPFIVVSGRQNGGTASDPEFDLTITVRGIPHEVHAAAKLERDGDVLHASGELRLSHTQLGLEPFTVLGGALSVEDGFDIRYRITARAR